MLNIIFLVLFAMAFFACNAVETEPKVVLGREWNNTAKVVADTASQFKSNDVIVILMDNGKPFPATEVELRVYQGVSGDRVLFKRSQVVKNKDTKAAIKGPDSKPLTVKDILRTSTPGTYRIAMAIGDSILAEKQLELVK
ncbi:MAG: hypothetical protein LBH25_13255 [Fibromonadaceae bacterium]|jgi:hypothetical protein|nr:hypothetical protein [Fibromonadaceae bacterium]